MRQWVRWWIEVWDRHEAPTVLALIRIGVGAVLLADFLTVWGLGLVEPLYVNTAHGGMSVADRYAAVPWWVTWFDGAPWSASLLVALILMGSASLMVGLATRWSALFVLLLYAQTSLILPQSDRAIDTLLRNVLLILVFARSGATWSLDAKLKSGKWSGTGDPVPAWPRYLLVLQLVVMYFTAGVQKYAQHWWPWGGYSALYVVLNDWSFAKYSFAWLARPPFYALTQVATAVTMFFQWTYPIVLPHYFPARRPPRGWWRIMEEWGLHWVWIGVGALFHVGIAATMALGIFPWGMLVLYPAYLHPQELDALVRRWRGR